MSITRQCEWCGADFEARRSTARYCQPAHRTAACRARAKAATSAAAGVGSAGTAEVESPGSAQHLAAATLAELQAAHVDGTALGAAAIILAVRIDALSVGVDPATAWPALVKEHAAAMTRALGGVVADTLDPFDELARRRDERRKAAGG